MREINPTRISVAKSVCKSKPSSFPTYSNYKLQRIWCIRYTSGKHKKWICIYSIPVLSSLHVSVCSSIKHPPLWQLTWSRPGTWRSCVLVPGSWAESRDSPSASPSVPRFSERYPCYKPSEDLSVCSGHPEPLLLQSAKVCLTLRLQQVTHTTIYITHLSPELFNHVVVKLASDITTCFHLHFFCFKREQFLHSNLQTCNSFVNIKILWTVSERLIKYSLQFTYQWSKHKLFFLLLHYCPYLCGLGFVCEVFDLLLKLTNGLLHSL